MSVDEHPNVATMRKIDAAMNAGDMEVGFAAMADDIEWHEIGRADPVVGKQALMEHFQAADWDYQSETHDMVGNDDHVVQLLNVTATRDGKTLKYRTAEIYHVKDGKVTARWAFSDDTKAITDFFG